MNIFIIKDKKIICDIMNATIVPRIGEKMEIGHGTYAVKDIIWHTRQGDETYIEIQVQ